jgi:hypothetical protein
VRWHFIARDIFRIYSEEAGKGVPQIPGVGETQRVELGADHPNPDHHLRAGVEGEALDAGIGNPQSETWGEPPAHVGEYGRPRSYLELTRPTFGCPSVDEGLCGGSPATPWSTTSLYPGVCVRR